MRGGGDQAGEWMRGSERRCMDEYALAVKGEELHMVGAQVCMLPYRQLWRSKTR